MAKKKKKIKDNPIFEEPLIEISSSPKKMNSFYLWDGDILILNILGTPNAKRDQIGKPFGNQLKVSVKESPRNGRATDYMVHFLAEEFGISTKDIEVVLGRFNVNKQLRITNPRKLPAQISPKLEPPKEDKTPTNRKGRRK